MNLLVTGGCGYRLLGAGGGLLNIGPLVRVKNASITESAWTARFDTWVLPFLDLYAVAGYVDGRASLDLRPTVLPIAPAKYNLNLKFEGPTVGLGATLAAACAAALVASVVTAVHHAEVVAHRVGEPFGTLVLALAPPSRLMERNSPSRSCPRARATRTSSPAERAQRKPPKSLASI